LLKYAAIDTSIHRKRGKREGDFGVIILPPVPPYQGGKLIFRNRAFERGEALFSFLPPLLRPCDKLRARGEGDQGGEAWIPAYAGMT
jgi:hypothetical protein